jgi:hypothetical protein
MVSSALSVTLCSQALVMVGADPITSIEDSTREAVICSALYEPMATAALCTYPWRFAMIQRQLALVTAEPLARYDNAYQIPADCLMVRAVTCLDQPLVYEIYNDLIYLDSGDEDEIILDYLYRADEANWSPLFRLAFSQDLAAAFSVSLAEDEKKQAAFATLAMTTWKRARQADGQSRTARSGLRSRLLNARRS